MKIMKIDGNQYIYFDLVEEKPKTQVWDVVNKKTEEPLARVDAIIFLTLRIVGTGVSVVTPNHQEQGY